MLLWTYTKKHRFCAALCTAVFLFMVIAVISSTTLYAKQMDNKGNKLADSFSPYLRQHQNNPVQWYEWGEEALAKAKAENKPILVSVGYATCYWCHVLEREVFMHEDAAAVMNEYFINIKIDREVRPDLDMVFMLATQMLSGNGGWPNNVFLTPDLKPFHGVTFMPKDYWMEMTQKVALLWQNQQEQLIEQSERLSSNITKYFASPPAVQVTLPVDQLALRALNEKKDSYDKRYGGFGAGVKFPEETDLLFLLEYARRTGDKTALEMVQNTVDHMLLGGIHDHVGGGFHRYSTEEKWQIPHFEKMLYNQAMMALVLTRLYQETKMPRYERALHRLMNYVLRDMTDDKTGGFYSAQDAETDEVEGAYYVWTLAEIERVLPPDYYAAFTDAYMTAPIPEIPGHKSPNGGVLYAKADASFQQSEAIETALKELHRIRAQRKSPAIDDKIITSWNGMMVYALAEASTVFEEERYARAARKAADFLIARMVQSDGRLSRIFMEGKAHQNGFLEDYAWTLRALLAVHGLYKEEKYMFKAIDIVAAADRYMKDPASGAYYMTDGSDGLFVRIKKGDTSGALPSGNAVMAQAYADFYFLSSGRKWKERFQELTGDFVQGISSSPAIYMHFISAMLRVNDIDKHSATQDTGEYILNDHGIIPTSKDKVSLSAILQDKEDGEDEYRIRVMLKIEEGWHVNANPASLSDLIPTTLNVQTDADSSYEVTYPPAQHVETPLGALDIYAGEVALIAKVKADDLTGLRAIVQVQACKDATCYAPSLVTIDVK